VKVAVISLSDAGARVAARLAAARDGLDVYLHSSVAELPQAPRFERVLELTAELFRACQGLIYVAPVGLVVRALAPCLEHKSTDPAVVVVDVGGRWAVSLLGGHEGGANQLALDVANRLDLIVGVGCRRGIPGPSIVAAIREALAAAGCELARVRLLASADVKAHEPGLWEAARELGLPLRIIAADEIAGSVRSFERSPFVQEMVGLPAVAEPAALLAGRRTRLILPKKALHGVTLAIAREYCPSLE
jgi:cobalt-precorrin 5A hydrolase